MIIYKITHKLNGRCYIGQTIHSLAFRWKQHCYSKSGCRYIHNAIQKYGKDAFSLDTIAEYKTLEDLNNAEEYYIDYYNSRVPNGYNLRAGGDNKKHHEETKKKISQSNKGKKISEESKKKMSLAKKGIPTNRSTNGMLGKMQTLEARIKIGKAQKGKKATKEARNKMSIAKKGFVPWNKGIKIGYTWMKGKKHTKETRKKMSEAKKGKTPWNKGLNGSKAPMFGKRHSEETLKKMSEARKAYYAKLKSRNI